MSFKELKHDTHYRNTAESHIINNEKVLSCRVWTVDQKLQRNNQIINFLFSTKIKRKKTQSATFLQICGFFCLLPKSSRPSYAWRLDAEN